MAEGRQRRPAWVLRQDLRRLLRRTLLLISATVAVGAALAAGDGPAATTTTTTSTTTTTTTDGRHSGSLDMGPALRAMLADDSQNPAFLWVASGKERWAQECEGCHGAVEVTMRGVARHFPRWNEAAGRVLSLNQQIRRCRGRTPVPPNVDGAGGPESEPVLALQALVALQSRGLPIEAARGDARGDAATTALARQGEALFHRRLGALALSCADCHEARPGLRLGGSVIPQAHPTGYPLYRLEWQGLGSLGRRLRACLVGVRATPFPPDGEAALAVEAYLMRRAAGMVFEAPGLRP